jgi:hypothetical protein
MARETAMNPRAWVQESHTQTRGARDGRFEKERNRQCLGLAHDVTDAVDHFF